MCSITKGMSNVQSTGFSSVKHKGLNNPEEGMEKLQSGKIKMAATTSASLAMNYSLHRPTGFYKDSVYDLQDKTKGLFRNHVVAWLYAHLYIGPSAIGNNKCMRRMACMKAHVGDVKACMSKRYKGHIMVSGKAPEKKGLNGPGPPATHSSNTAKKPLPQEDIEAIMSAMRDYDSAEQYLASALLCQANKPLTLLHLVGILFQITQMVKTTPCPVINAICMVAFILKQQAASELAKTVAQQITESLTPKIVNSIIAAIASQVASILTTSETLQENQERNEQERCQWRKLLQEPPFTQSKFSWILHQTTHSLFQMPPMPPSPRISNILAKTKTKTEDTPPWGEQCFTFAIMQVKDAAIANNLLKEGICINSHQYTVYKDKKEPLHCAKCQKFRHMARNCSALYDVYGTCGGQHWTS
ncbi:hypothetical protein BDR06DRAFT_977303 [Suillus hirtellus]|nr:hypothetical protein BDR06DRAFT_977303 [Suillus hirtellus]